MEFVLVNIYVQAGFTQLCKYFANVLSMLLKRFAINKDIIDICLREIVQIFKKKVIDIMLLGSWFIGQSERHYFILIYTYTGSKGSEFLALRTYTQ